MLRSKHNHEQEVEKYIESLGEEGVLEEAAKEAIVEEMEMTEWRKTLLLAWSWISISVILLGIMLWLPSYIGLLISILIVFVFLTFYFKSESIKNWLAQIEYVRLQRSIRKRLAEIAKEEGE